MRKFMGTVLGVAMLIAAPSAMADKVAGSPNLLESLDGSIVANPVGGGEREGGNITSVDVGGNDVFFGFPGVVQINVPLAPNATVTGVGWKDIDIEAFSPSWLSEIRFELVDSTASMGVGLTPGVGNDAPGRGTFDSFGIIKLADLGLEFDVGPDGLLVIHIWDTFNDHFPNPDGFVHSGHINIQWIPEPASLLLIGLGGLLFRRR